MKQSAIVWQTPSKKTSITDANGNIFSGGSVAPAADYALEVKAKKDTNFLNGVTSLDLLNIQKHLLGVQPFTSPFQYLAADANQDGRVSMFDVLVLQKLILGISSDLPNHKSWRFVPRGFVFPPGIDPLLASPPGKISLPPSEWLPTHFEFTGVKIGEVNFTAFPEN